MIGARVFLLGHLRVTRGPAPRGPTVAVGSGGPLLAYLALHANRPVPRTSAAFQLWPDADEATARRRLRQALHRLRRLLTELQLPPTLLNSDHGRLRLDDHPALWIDVVAFQTAATRRERQIEALELYVGDLLPDWGNSWLVEPRRRLREQAATLLRAQIDTALMRRNFPRARHYAERLLTLDPLRESTVRILMETLTLGGNRPAALRHYAQLQVRLRQALDADPMPETSALYQQLRRGVLPRRLPPLPGVYPHPAAWESSRAVDADLIGRETALVALDDALAAAAGGSGRFLLFTGPAGSGKSFLLHSWLAARAPLLRLLDAGTPPAGTVALQGVDTALADQLPAGHPLPAALQALRTGASHPLAPDQLADLLLTAARHAAPATLLLLDDLHLATPATWQLVAYLARRGGAAPLLLLGSAAPRRLTADAAALLGALQRESRVIRHPLPLLNRAETGQLAARRLGPPLPVDLRNRLFRATDGLPRFITAYLEAGPSPAALAAALNDVPPGLAHPLNEALQSVGPAGLTLLRHAAAVGRSFHFRDLQEAAPEKTVLTVLEKALDLGLIQPYDDGYRFTYDLVRRLAGRSPEPMTGTPSPKEIPHGVR